MCNGFFFRHTIIYLIGFEVEMRHDIALQLMFILNNIIPKNGKNLKWTENTLTQTYLYTSLKNKEDNKQS